jgi:hypothetical protein
MAITDISFSEELQTNAPPIKYKGDEGPKSPQEIEQRMAGPVLPNDPTTPVNPFAPKPQGPVLPNKQTVEVEYFELFENANPEFKGMDRNSDEYLFYFDDYWRGLANKKQEGSTQRQMAAYGGIMGVDGRRRYGIGSSLKKFVRNVIPNEVSEIAVKAAPFVAPFNPLLAAGMAGIGGFDQHGSISRGLKSGLMTYGMGQLTRGAGGGMGNLQTGFNPFNSANLPGAGTGTFSKFFSNPLQGEGGLSEFLRSKKVANAANAERALMTDNNIGFGNQNKNFLTKTINKIGEYVPKSFSDLTDPKKIAGATGIAYVASKLLGNPEAVVSQIMNRGEGLDLAGIRAEVQEAFNDSSGEKLKALRIKYPYLGTLGSKNMAQGGRIGFSEGGNDKKINPDNYMDPRNLNTEDLILLVRNNRGTPEIFKELMLRDVKGIDTLMLDMMGGKKLDKPQEVFQVNERALKDYRINQRSPIESFLYDLRENNPDIYGKYREPAQFMPTDAPDNRAQGGRIGFSNGGNLMAGYGYNEAMSDTYDSFLDMKKKGLIPPTMDFDEFLQEVVPEMSKTKEPKRVMAQEGGLMDLGGMEKDYRAEGGFVPIGKKEKADDVPARLSVNEFVFTADAVRNAGGGDIDKGAEVMENMMKNLEAGGQVSEESQGLAGAQQMFETSERLSEVI